MFVRMGVSVVEGMPYLVQISWITEAFTLRRMLTMTMGYSVASTGTVSVRISAATFNKVSTYRIYKNKLMIVHNGCWYTSGTLVTNGNSVLFLVANTLVHSFIYFNIIQHVYIQKSICLPIIHLLMTRICNI